jgi:hypothetical protein
MSPITEVFRGVLYLAAFDEKREPILIACGKPVQVPASVYAQASRAELEPAFQCTQCNAAVISLASERGLMQLCQCQTVLHLQSQIGYTTRDQWTGFRELHQEKSRDPLPDTLFQIDPFSGEPLGLTKEGKAHLSRVQGFKRSVNWSEDGSLLKVEGGSSVYSDAEKETVSAWIKSQDDAEDILHALLRQSPVPPPIIITVGDDPDYVFPPGAFDIQPLPFRCQNCKARVKRARLDLVHADRGDSCLCMAAVYRRDTRGAGSAAEWKSYRQLYLQNLVQHQATAADGQS